MSDKLNSSPGKKPVKQEKGMQRPALPDRLFWDMRVDDINWPDDYRTIITRVIERGDDEEWVELIRFYGTEKILHTLKFESTFFSAHTISRVCSYFKLKPEELRCYIREPWRKGHWT